MLFNIVVDMLAIMIECAWPNCRYDSTSFYGCLSILLYSNDTILFMENDIEKVRNLELIMSAFEQLSGLKINFH